jgi:hypothetical protein
MTDRLLRRASVALKPVDDLTSSLVQSAEIRTAASAGVALRKSDGFFVFSNLPDGAHTITIEEPSYRTFDIVLSLPLPNEDRLLLSIQGENEEFLVVSSVDAPSRTLTFQSRTFRPALRAGSPVITSRVVTALSEELEGEGVVSAVVDDVGTGATLIQPGDFVRIVRERLVRLRPGPYYPFEDETKRLTGAMIDALTSQPIVGGEARLQRVDNVAVSSRNVGTSSANRARIYFFDSGTPRIIGTERDISATTDARGRFAFTFSQRLSFDPTSLRLRFSAPGYVTTNRNTSFVSGSAAFANVPMTPS